MRQNIKQIKGNWYLQHSQQQDTQKSSRQMKYARKKKTDTIIVIYYNLLEVKLNVKRRNGIPFLSNNLFIFCIHKKLLKDVLTYNKPLFCDGSFSYLYESRSCITCHSIYLLEEGKTETSTAKIRQQMFLACLVFGSAVKCVGELS